MQAVFVQIKCEMGKAYEVARDAADRMPELSELFSTSGPCDLQGRFYLAPGQDVGLFVTDRIQVLPGVRDTRTLITFNAFRVDAGDGPGRSAPAYDAAGGGRQAAKRKLQPPPIR